MNTFNFMGRMTAKPELRTFGDNTVLYFTLAANKPTSNKEHPESDFIPFTAFGKTAENIAKFFDKGDMMAVTAHLSSGRVQSKTAPDTMETRISQIVDRFDFCQSKAKSDAAKADSSTSAEVPSEGLPF